MCTNSCIGRTMTRQFNNGQIWVKDIKLYMIFRVSLKVLDFKMFKVHN